MRSIPKALSFSLMTNPTVFPTPGHPDIAGVWSFSDVSLDEPDLHQLQDLSPNDWVLPFTARIAVSRMPPRERAVPLLSRRTSSPAEDPNHTVFALHGLLDVSLPAEKSLLMSRTRTFGFGLKRSWSEVGSSGLECNGKRTA